MNVPVWVKKSAAWLASKQGHAWLIHGSQGLGQFELGWELAKAWLCESRVEGLACGTCQSCHWMSIKSHPECYPLMPEATLLEQSFSLPEKLQSELDAGKRKASQEIRIDQVRDMTVFTQLTSNNPKGRVVLIYPAHRMGIASANALLKTLEEPPQDVKLILVTQAMHAVLPTIKSRCQHYTMHWPNEEESVQWLISEGLSADDAKAWLKLAGSRPQAAKALSQSEVALAEYQRFPEVVASGAWSSLQSWSIPLLLEALQKLLHDIYAKHAGASPRFFAEEHLQKLTPNWAALENWSKTLRQDTKTVNHPYHTALMQEAMLMQAKVALTG